MNPKWDKKYLEKLKTDEKLFKHAFLCMPVANTYCHNFGNKHFFLHNKCEICGIRYSKFRDLIERGIVYDY